MKLGFSIKSTFFAVGLFALTTFTAFALPGVKSYIPDVSGEYIFYRDNSFKRESYIGFLFYDESTYAARYFAPKTKELPEKNIEFLFTVDPSKDTLEMTGERIITDKEAIHQEEADIINYIHDLIYEFSSRRRKAGDISPAQQKNPESLIYITDTGIDIRQDYGTFGGDVSIRFDYLVPIFNVKKIIDNKGVSVFEIATVGRLESSDDTSFSSFKNTKIVMPKSKKSIVNKKAKPINYQVSSNADANLKFSQSVIIDDSWKRTDDSLCTLQERAFLTIDEMVDSNNTDSVYLINSLLRNAMQSTQQSYVDWRTLKIQYSPIGFVVRSNSYQPSDGTATKGAQIVSEMDTGRFGYMNLIAYTPDYDANLKYFDNIIRSYKFFKAAN